MTCECVPYAEARRAAVHILRHGYGVDIRKSLDPLNPDDFLVMVQTLADELSAITGPLEREVVRAAIAALDVNFATASAAEIRAIAHAANLAMKDIPAKTLPAITEKMKVSAQTLVGSTKTSVSATYNITVRPAFDVQDARIVNALSSISTWVTDEYGKRAAMFESNISRVIQDGLEQGLRNEDIAADLRVLGDKVGVSQPEAYWNIVASNASTRSRSYGEVKSFKDAGIASMVFFAVMDERTTLECRALHGTVFSVNDALGVFEDLETATRTDNQAAETMMPFVKRESLGGGVTRLYVDRGNGQTSTIAHAIGSAVGQRDVRGTFANVASPGDLAKMGVIVPPLHHLCRSTIIPG